VAPATPRELAALVDRCLEREPAKRPRDGGELLALLEPIAQAIVPSGELAAGAWSGRQHGAKRRWIPWAAALVVTIALVLAARMAIDALDSGDEVVTNGSSRVARAQPTTSPSVNDAVPTPVASIATHAPAATSSLPSIAGATAPALPSPAAPTPAPAAVAVATGVLQIDARPWGQLTRLVGADGRALALPAGRRSPRSRSRCPRATTPRGSRIRRPTARRAARRTSRRTAARSAASSCARCARVTSWEERRVPVAHHPAAVVLFALLASASVARADYRQAYLDGRAALARGDAGEAARLLASAATERPTELARARLVGAIPEPYLPHHYLALAYARLDRCTDALREWDASAAQGVAASLPASAAEARDGVASCRKKLGLADPAEAAAAARAASRADLVRALDAFLGGSYARTVELLDSMAAPADSSMRAWQLTLRSAARHALYRLGGEHDALLLAAAIADAREARRADPGFRPSADLFSPRFVELYAAQH
jgi:hypothetical protein